MLISSTGENLGFSNTQSGGHTGRSMMFLEMRTLVQSLPPSATKDDLAQAIVDENLLGKPTLSSRKESLSRLTQLYGMDTSKALFRVFWALGHEDPDSLPQLCLICAYARDPQLRHSFRLIRALRPGELMIRAAMERHLEEGFPNRFSTATKESMARNVNTTWTFGGHLDGKVKKTRKLAEPRPVSAAYAMFVGYLVGLRGEKLLDSPFAELISSNRSQLQSALALASARGLLSLRQAADVVEFDFSNLLTQQEEAFLRE
jgi:hypothetical protein